MASLLRTQPAKNAKTRGNETISAATSSAQAPPVVAQKPVQNVELEALVVEPYFASPDSSVAIVSPAVEGEGYKFASATTFTGSSNITITPTPGTTSTPPNVNVNIPSTAIVPSPNPALTPVNVVYNAGVFELGVNTAAVSGLIPRTIVVGGSIGTTPNASTIAAAVALLPPGPYPADQPWNLLFCPGVYTVAGTLAIPPNVNLIALEPGSVYIGQNLTITDTGASDVAVQVSGITFNSSLTWTMSGKTGGTSSLTLRNCNYTAGTLTLATREQSTTAPVLGVYRDQARIDSCVISSAVTLTGGMTIVTNSRQIGGVFALTSVGPGTISRLQVSNSVFSPATFSQTLSFSSFRACTLGGVWLNNGLTSSINIFGCTATGTVATGGATIWTLACNNSSTASIKNTPLETVVSRTGPLAWTIVQTNLLPGTIAPLGSINRDIDFTLLSVNAAPSGANLSVTLEVPLTTSFQAAVGAPPYTQPSVTSAIISGANIYISKLLTTAALLTLINQITFVTDANVSVRAPVPSVVWYP